MTLRNLAAACAVLFGVAMASIDVIAVLRGGYRFHWEQIFILLTLAAGGAVFIGRSVRFVSLVLVLVTVRYFGFFRLVLVGLVTGRLRGPVPLMLLGLGMTTFAIVGLIAALAADQLWRTGQV